MLTSIVVGAVLGAIGGGIGMALAKYFSGINGGENISRLPAVVGAALALTLSHPLSEWFNRPTSESVLENMEETEPFYKSLRENYSEHYSKIKRAIDLSIDRGSIESAKPEIRAIILPLFSNLLPNASDDTLFAFALLVRDQARALAETNSTACVSLLKGEPFAYLSVMPAELVTRENGIYRRVFSEPIVARDVANESQVNAYLDKLLLGVQRDLGVSRIQVVSALNLEGPADLQCRANAALFDGFTKSWSQEGGPKVLRALLKSRSTS